MNKDDARGVFANLRRENIFYKQCQNNNRKNCEAGIMDRAMWTQADHFSVVQLVT